MITRKARRVLCGAMVVVGLAAGPALAGTESGYRDCGSRWLGITSRSSGATGHGYSNGQQFSWFNSSWQYRYSTSALHEGGWAVEATYLDYANTTSACRT